MQHSNLIYTHWPERQHHCCQSECASLSISKCPDEPFCCQRSAHGCCGESHQHKSPLNLNFVNSSHSVQRYQSWICNMRTVLEGWPAAARGGGGGGSGVFGGSDVWVQNSLPTACLGLLVCACCGTKHVRPCAACGGMKRFHQTVENRMMPNPGHGGGCASVWSAGLLDV